MDLCLFGKNHGLPAETIAKAARLDVPMVERVWADIDRKRETTRYLHLKPALVESISEISA
jgi:NAD+ synthase